MRKTLIVLVLGMMLLNFGTRTVSADTLYLGIDIQGPVQEWTTTGTFIRDFGQSGAAGVALDGAGNFWTEAPAFGNNRIARYDASGTEQASFIATVNQQWIEDMTYGDGFLWASTYEGYVFKLDPTTGTVQDSFDSSASYAGVTFDGTYLYTTNGFFGDDSIEKWTTSGTFVSSISTGFDGGAGLGYSYSTNSFWVGYLSGVVRQFDTSGNLLSSFTTTYGVYSHDGLEVDSSVPEPSTLLLLAAGLTGVGLLRRKLRK